jgi:hypothetical protein
MMDRFQTAAFKFNLRCYNVDEFGRDKREVAEWILNTTGWDGAG